MTETQTKKDNLAKFRAKRRTFTKPLMSMMVVAAFVVLGYKLWENPRLLQQAQELLSGDGKKEDVVRVQIEQMQQHIALLETQLNGIRSKVENPDFSEIYRKIDNIEQISVNTVKSKADIETVLGLIVRMDNAEGKIVDLAKVTDKSALVLTAVMLVKDAAERGGKFVYEAEVLSELASGNHKIDKEVAFINDIASKGVPSKEVLQRMFADIFADKYAVVDEDMVVADNWKDRIYQQVNKVVKIKKSDKQENQPEFSEEDRAWGIINDFVVNGEIARAVAIARKPLNANILKNVDFEEWLQSAEQYEEFNASVSRISANALAAMKVKFLQSGM